MTILRRWSEALKNLKKRLLDYVWKSRKAPRGNRERVGQNLMILAVVLFFIFIINFIVIVGTDTKFGQVLSEGAKSVYQTTQTIQAKRGTIYDRDGNVIAEDSTTYAVYAIIDTSYVDATGKKLYVQPSQYNKVAEIFNQQLGIDTNYTISQLQQKNLKQVSFGSDGSGLSYSKMTELQKACKDAGIDGISFTTSPGRSYPNGTFASHFIGLAQLKENKDGTSSLTGRTGLESSLNSILSGTDGTVVYQKDRNGNTLLGTGTVTKKAVDGKDVYTTLSAPLQTYLETQMDAFQQQAEGVQASATVVNAKTGEILATTQRPTFNATTLEGLNSENFSWTTTLYQANFEPGSTMKTMLLASAIDNGSFNPNETYTNNGINVYDTIVNDWTVNEGLSPQTLTFAQGFSLSSNVGMTLLEEKMGNSKWSNYLQKFRFGYPTRFGLDDETAGMISDNAANVVMSAFGQGISVTQVQMLRAFSAVANNGVMLEPQFISKIYDSNNRTTRLASQEVVGNPVSSEAASQTRNYMVNVGTDPFYGTMYANGAPIIQVGNESVAVKSGTAQIASNDGTGYLQGATDYIYSVVAMVPSSDPDFIMYVTLQQPKHWSNSYYATVVNPVLTEAEQMKESLMTTPQASSSSQGETNYKMPSVVGKAPGLVAQNLRDNLVHPVIVGTGNKIIQVSVKEGKNLAANQQILLLTDTVTTVPDMYGWTKENVETFAKWQGISVTFKGSKTGHVIAQNKETGSSLKNIKKLTLTLGE